METTKLLDELYNELRIHDYDMDGFGNGYEAGLRKAIEIVERKQQETEQQSNCNLPHVSNLVCPTHGTMLYKHANGLAYCSLCNYSVSWQTGC